MIKTLIASRPDFKREVEGNNFLEVAEFFTDTIQGEGIHIGHPATFLRMQHCTMNCIWCDTQSVWRYGNPYTFDELFEIMDNNGVVDKLYLGQHLVLTGGSPLKQEKRLLAFLKAFDEMYGFLPYTEIENECTIMPSEEFIGYIDCWNNSPKLENSSNLDIIRYQPKILKALSNFHNSWFKFVITNEDDWDEIKRDFIDTLLIRKDQIILMPQGATRSELHKNQQKVVEIAVRESVLYCSRQHVELWDEMTGV